MYKMSEFVLKEYLFEKKKLILFSDVCVKYYYVLKNNKIQKYKNEQGELIEIIDLENVCEIEKKIKKKYKVIILINNNIKYIKKIYFCDDKVHDKWFHSIYNIINTIKYKSFEKELEILQSIGDSCIITDDLLNIIAFNGKAEILLEYKKNEILTKSLKILLPDYYSIYYNGIFHSKKIKEYSTRRLFIITKSKKIIPISVSIGEYISKNYFKKVFIFSLRELYVRQQKENIDHDTTKIFDSIIQFSEELKNKIINQLSVENKIKEEQLHKIEVLEEENKNLMQINNELNIKIRELDNNLNYFKKKSCNIDILQILNNEFSYNCFFEFCKESKTEEYLLFWKTLTNMKNKYKEDPNNHDILNESIKIYEKYIKKDSEYELNISDNMRTCVFEQLEAKKDLYNLFDNIIHEIIFIINNNILPLFIITTNGRKVAKIFS